MTKRLRERARLFGYSIRKIDGEWRLINDRLNAAMYFPRDLEQISEFLSA
ncbi:hypothetical protein OOJ09_31500 [Mesorhizobium qingshengii]|uniref:Uncharacterized protein n=1 Tax=Mesorhizobium qingshengii TaxID=1165689 RepID=A0ABT4R4F0_9HYPH|nr:hypothetical protein [Mesorhizobium qingshengii]MCZ8548703.1 hypothetical protein [Mesorhizobium qingshengii]